MKANKTLEWGLFLAVVVGGFLIAGPASLGGPASFVVVDGTSMEPTYKGGDLVIAKEASSYAIGDVITYDAPTQQRFRVIHRVIEASTAGYRTQGDNRDEPDGWLVEPTAVHGATWVHIPHAGTALTLLRQPATLAAIVAGALTLSVLSRRERLQVESHEEDHRHEQDIALVARRTHPRGIAVIKASALLTACALLGVSGALMMAKASRLQVNGHILQVFERGVTTAPPESASGDCCSVG